MLNNSIGTTEYIAISSVVIALLTAAATFWQAYLARKHSRLSAKPYLDWIVNRFPDKPIEMILVNKGLGPAFVRSILFQLDDEVWVGTEEQDWATMRIQTQKLPFSVKWTTFASGSVIAIHDQISLLKISREKLNAEELVIALEFIDRYGFEIKYASMYQEVFSLVKPPKTTIKG